MTDEVTPAEELTLDDLPQVEEYIGDMGEEGLQRMLEMVGDFSEELRSEWSRIRKRRHNQSQKGDAFEDTLKDFLEQYFSSVFEFRTGCALMDSELRCFKEFDRGGNEFDVVASYRTAIPHVVFEEAGMYWVPYDGVSFLCEVKSSLNKSALEHDLEKLDTLAGLRGDPRDRFGGPLVAREDVHHQLHCLVYDEGEIGGEARRELFHEYSDAWDLLLIIEEDKLFINSTLPIAETLFGKEKEDHEFTWCHISSGLLWFVVSLATSIPQPILVDTTKPLVKMGTFMGVSTGGGHFKHNPD